MNLQTKTILKNSQKRKGEDTKDKWYLALTKTGKHVPMKLRSDYRAAVSMKSRLHHESGEQVEERLHPNQQRRWNSSSSASLWDESGWNWNIQLGQKGDCFRRKVGWDPVGFQQAAVDFPSRHHRCKSTVGCGCGGGGGACGGARWLISRKVNGWRWRCWTQWSLPIGDRWTWTCALFFSQLVPRVSARAVCGDTAPCQDWWWRRQTHEDECRLHVLGPEVHCRRDDSSACDSRRRPGWLCWVPSLPKQLVNSWRGECWRFCLRLDACTETWSSIRTKNLLWYRLLRMWERDELLWEEVVGFVRRPRWGRLLQTVSRRGRPNQSASSCL